MPVQTAHRFPLHLSVLHAAGRRVTLADLRGQARAVAVYFMRTGTCPVCIHHARTLARRTYPPTTCSRSWWYPVRRRTPPGVRRILGDRVTVVRYGLATALPAGRFDGPTLQAAIDRP